MEITLIRHGESAGNTLNVYQGWGDFQLTELGRRQADVTMGRLEDVRYDRILTSDAHRAVETAKLIFPRQTHLIECCRSLRGIDCGDLCGLTQVQALKRYGEHFADRDRFDFTPFHGEDQSAMVNRIHDLMRELEEGPDHRIAVITHGGPIRAMLFYILHIDFVTHFNYFDLRNCGVSKIRYSDNAWRIITVNDYSHVTNARVYARPSTPAVDGI